MNFLEKLLARIIVTVIWAFVGYFLGLGVGLIVYAFIQFNIALYMGYEGFEKYREPLLVIIRVCPIIGLLIGGGFGLFTKEV